MKKNRKSIIKWLFPLISLIILVSIFAANNEMDNLMDAVQLMKPGYIALALMLMVGYWFLESVILHRLVYHTETKISFRESIRITLAGQFFNGITPFASGGQPAQLYMLHKNKVSIGTGASVLTKKFIVYQVVLVLYSLVVIVFESRFFLKHIPNFTYLGFIGFTVNLVVIAFLLLVGFNYKFTKGLMIRISMFMRKRFKSRKINHTCLKILKQINMFHRQMRNSNENMRTWFTVILYTWIQLTCFFAIPLVIGYGFQLTQLSILYMMGAAAFVSMVTAFIPLPGAALGAEGSFYLVYQMFFPSKIVVAALLLWRLFTYYLPLLVGGTVVIAGNNLSANDEPIALES